MAQQKIKIKAKGVPAAKKKPKKARVIHLGNGKVKSNAGSKT